MPPRRRPQPARAVFSSASRVNHKSPDGRRGRAGNARSATLAAIPWRSGYPDPLLIRDPAAADDLVAAVEDGRLAGCGRPRRTLQLDLPASTAIRSVCLHPAYQPRHGLCTMANAHLGRKSAVSRRLAGHEAEALDRELPSLQVLPARERHEVRSGVDRTDVPPLAQRDAESCALPDRVCGRSMPRTAATNTNRSLAPAALRNSVYRHA